MHQRRSEANEASLSSSVVAFYTAVILLPATSLRQRPPEPAREPFRQERPRAGGGRPSQTPLTWIHDPHWFWLHSTELGEIINKIIPYSYAINPGFVRGERCAGEQRINYFCGFTHVFNGRFMLLRDLILFSEDNLFKWSLERWEQEFLVIIMIRKVWKRHVRTDFRSAFSSWV